MSRRILAGMVAVVLSILSPCLLRAGELPTARLDAANAAVDYRDGVYYGTLNLAVAVPPPIALEVLTDFEHMAEFVPNLSVSKVLAHEGRIFRIFQQGRANFGPLSFDFESERQIEVFPDGRLLSRGISGTSRYLRSELAIASLNDGIRLDYRIEMVPDRWLPPGIAIYFIRHELAEQFMALGREMERRQKLRATAKG